jgi:diguanylate cyclase (GGDEF)-like protein
MRILFLAANPRDTPQLALDEEAREIQEKLRLSDFREEVTLVTRWAVRVDDLLQILNEERPTIVHFSGHGNKTSEICLQDNTGNSVPLNRDVLVSLFSAFNDTIRLVYLNCCYSKEQSKAISRIVDFTLGVESSIQDIVAIKFASSFYRALAFRRTVREAYQQGLLGIALEKNSETNSPANTPQLIVKKGSIDTQVLVGTNELCSNRKKRSLKLISESRINTLVDKDRGNQFLSEEITNYLANEGINVFSVALFDIDKLTQINNAFSEEVGNIVIRKIAILLVEYISNQFLGGRCGDDTFYILFPNIGREHAARMCADFLLAIHNYKWNRIAPGLKASITFGVAAHRLSEPPKDTVVRAAVAMNQAKEGEGECYKEENNVYCDYLKSERRKYFDGFYKKYVESSNNKLDNT